MSAMEYPLGALFTLIEMGMMSFGHTTDPSLANLFLLLLCSSLSLSPHFVLNIPPRSSSSFPGKLKEMKKC